RQGFPLNRHVAQQPGRTDSNQEDGRHRQRPVSHQPYQECQAQPGQNHYAATGPLNGPALHPTCRNIVTAINRHAIYPPSARGHVPHRLIELRQIPLLEYSAAQASFSCNSAISSAGVLSTLVSHSATMLLPRMGAYTLRVVSICLWPRYSCTTSIGIPSRSNCVAR